MINMPKIIVMPDSFKGTMDAIEVCDIMKAAILAREPQAEVICVPVADGGEGTIACFLHAFGGERIPAVVTGPYGAKKEAYYGRSGNTAIVEMAVAAGFSTVSGERNPAKATTYGVGELIRQAVESGCRRIILGLGGSCTNDGGAGMAAALGVLFYNAEGKPFIPTGNTLHQISRIDTASCERFLQGITVEAMCDIDNPLYGSRGAAFVFAPQKGADEAMVKELDQNLRCYAAVISRELGVSVETLKGGGAAGGMGAGAYVFLHADLKQGINVILDQMQFEDMLPTCDLIFTGEGQLDLQSLGGKVVVGISRRAMKAGVPVVAVAGRVQENLPDLTQVGITAAYQADPGTYRDLQDMQRNCRHDLYRAMERALDELQL